MKKQELSSREKLLKAVQEGNIRAQYFEVFLDHYSILEKPSRPSTAKY